MNFFFILSPTIPLYKKEVKVKKKSIHLQYFQTKSIKINYNITNHYVYNLKSNFQVFLKIYLWLKENYDIMCLK